MKKLSVILSIVALVLSLFSLYVACMNPTKDSTPNLIATLGVICTVLIGWQIFSLVNLFQYEKRIKTLEEEIEHSKNDLNDAMASAYKSMYESQGLLYHNIANIYHHLWHPSHNPKEVWLFQELSNLLIEIDGCLYTQNLKELNRAKSNITASTNSGLSLPDALSDILRDQWKTAVENFKKSKFQKTDAILIEIDNVTRLIDSL
ncbi:MAG: hypothetical protein K2K45_07690 [Muribaculaceae bacterium]|nr:hypothetical protein [Muribaculaceae bacterium]